MYHLQQQHCRQLHRSSAWSCKPTRGALVCNSLWGPRGTSKAATAATESSSVQPSSKSGGVALQSKPTHTKPQSPPSSGPSNPGPNAVTELQSAVTEFASQLLSQLSWPSLPSYPQEEAQLATPAESSSSTAEVDLTSCLQSVPVWELKHMRKLCHLTALTYKMARVTPRSMMRRHQLVLVTTSWACEIRAYEHSKSAEEIAEEGDGQAVSVADAMGVYRNLLGRAPPPDTPPPVTALSNIVPLSLEAPPKDSKQGVGMGSPAVHVQQQPASSLGLQLSMAQQDQQEREDQQQGSGSNAASRNRSPAEVVAGMVVGAASAAASAASASVTPLASAAVTPIASAVTPLASAVTPIANSAAAAAGSLYAGLASLPIASALGATQLSSAPAAAAAIMSAATQAVRVGITDIRLTPSQAVGLAAAAGPAAIAAAPAGTRLRLAAPVQSTTSSPACPSEWFVCDDSATYTRYFVIQGSDSVDHWKLNLSFDSVPFESPSLGIKVHRGAYEAAQILYDRFLPMVYEHLDSSPFSKICFTGHSIGGSLGMLLALMYYHRGVLPAANLATVYTFGSPAVFCMEPAQHCDAAEHAHAPSHSHSHQHHKSAAGHGHHQGHPHEPHAEPRHHLVHARHKQHQSEHASTASSNGKGSASKLNTGSNGNGNGGNGNGKGNVSKSHTGSNSNGSLSISKVPASSNGNGAIVKSQAATGVPCVCGTGRTALAALGLPEHAVRNVMMARDLVPRAFVCDYSLVADILRSWGPSFKVHGGLSHKQRHMYYFTGRMMVMQPDNWHWFAQPEPDHPLLPNGPEMYLVGPPSPDAVHSQSMSAKQSNPVAAAASTVAEAASEVREVAADAAEQLVGPAAAAAIRPKRAAASEAEALWALMNAPHPLEILAETSAYLEKGSISRYHNPDNYTAALGRLIYIKRKQEGRIPTWISHSYSRSLGMEKTLETTYGYDPVAVIAGQDDIKTWDSSDGDTVESALVAYPALLEPAHPALTEAEVFSAEATLP